MENQRIEQLAELFRKRENINAEINKIIAIGSVEITDSEQMHLSGPIKPMIRDEDEEDESEHTGRKRLSEIEKENIVRCWKAGDVVKTICRKFNVSPATVWRLTNGVPREKEPQQL